MRKEAAISAYLASIGARGGKATSPAKSAAARANGAKFKRRLLPCRHCEKPTLKRDKFRRADCRGT